MSAPSSPVAVKPHPTADDEGHALGHLTGELDVSSAPYRVIRACGKQLLLVGVVQPQRRCDDAQRLLAAVRGWRTRPRPRRGAVRRAGPHTRPSAGTSTGRRRRRRATAAGSMSCTRGRPRRRLTAPRRARSCGSMLATRFSIAQTSSGGSSSENVVVTVIECAPGGRLRLVKDAAASTEFGMICSPLPVSIWVARQLTSTTRPRAVGVSSQSPSWNGCSNSTSRPEMICPTEFCNARPRTMDDDTQRGEQTADVGAPDVGEDQPPGRARSARSAPRRGRSIGIRLRQVPSGAPWNSVAFEPGQQQHQHDEAEHGRHDAHRRRLGRTPRSP